MTTLKLGALLLAVAGIPGMIIADTTESAGAAAPAMAGDPSICETTAVFVHYGAHNEAIADLYLNIARCLNNVGSSLDLFACLHEAWVEHQEAIELADDQFEARLDLCEELGPGPYDPAIDPMQFSTTLNNNLLPFVPGRTMIYEQQTAEGLEHTEVTTLNDTVEIEGVLCRAVNDVVFLDNEVIEDTIDWFAQHMNGDTWYFGEVAKNYEDGFLDNLDGSWRFGKDDAKPGIVMLASPLVDDIYRQEYLIDEAEDVAKVISLNETVVVPWGTFTNCVQTEEWSPLEPDAREHKYYAPGLGLVLEVDLETNERNELVQVIN